MFWDLNHCSYSHLPIYFIQVSGPLIFHFFSHLSSPFPRESSFLFAGILSLSLSLCNETKYFPSYTHHQTHHLYVIAGWLLIPGQIIIEIWAPSVVEWHEFNAFFFISLLVCNMNIIFHDWPLDHITQWDRQWNWLNDTFISCVRIKLFLVLSIPLPLYLARSLSLPPSSLCCFSISTFYVLCYGNDHKSRKKMVHAWKLNGRIKK